MKFLQICHKSPFPNKDGGCVAMNQLTRALELAGHKILVAAFDTAQHPFSESEFPAEYKELFRPVPLHIPAEIKPLPALIALVQNRPYNFDRYLTSPALDRLTQLLDHWQPDAIILDGLYAAVYLHHLRKRSKAKIILRTHNVEAEIWRQKSASTNNKLKSWYLSKISDQTARVEKQTALTVDEIWCISGVDQASFAAIAPLKPCRHIPVSFDMSETSTSASPHTVGFLGAMSWEPNQEGLNWFLKEVWPLVCSQSDRLSFHYAGRGMNCELFAHFGDSRTKCLGEIANADDFIRRCSIVVVPVRSGGGVKVKLLEALKHGKAVVCTPQAAAEVGLESEIHLLIADTPGKFAEALLRLDQDQELPDKLGKNARNWAEKNFSQKVIAAQLNQIFASWSPK